MGDHIGDPTAQDSLAKVYASLIGRDGRYQTDYALTRLVAANCAAIGPHADLAMVSDDLEMEGPNLIKWPSDMTAQERVSDGLASWILLIRYRGPDGVARNGQCDLNDRSRAIRQRPPQKRVLNGLFIDPFPVWTATTEEIVGEKMFALMDSRSERRTLRVKDIYDLRHVLRLEHERVIAPETRSIYEGWQQAAKPGVAPRLAEYGATLTALA